MQCTALHRSGMDWIDFGSRSRQDPRKRFAAFEARRRRIGIGIGMAPRRSELKTAALPAPGLPARAGWETRRRAIRRCEQHGAGNAVERATSHRRLGGHGFACVNARTAQGP